MGSDVYIQLASLCLTAILGGILLGNLSGKWDIGGDLGKGEKVLTVLVYGLGCVDAFLTFIMMLSMEWGAIFRHFLLALGLLALVTWMVQARRVAKYRKNPVVKEIARYVKEHNVMAIRCYPDGVMCYDQLLNSDYCKSRELETPAIHQLPATWTAYNTTAAHVKTFRFADHGYPDVQNIAFFAKGLKSRLPGFAVAFHSARSRSQSGNTITITYYHRDGFVYSKVALNRVQEQELIQRQAQKKREKAAQKSGTGPKTWE